jgi:hypothetical protein
MGDWSASMQKYHEPIRGKGIRDALRHRGFEVLLLEEFPTSKACPSCLQPSLKKSKRVTNPRTWRNDEYPIVTCHGLLRCNNQICMETEVGNHQYWNRDLPCFWTTVIYRMALDQQIATASIPETKSPTNKYVILRNGYRQWLLTMPVSKISKYRRRLERLTNENSVIL